MTEVLGIDGAINQQLMDFRMIYVFITMGHQAEAMICFLQEPELLVEKGRVVDHQIIFQIHQQIGAGTVGDQVISAGQRQILGCVGC